MSLGIQNATGSPWALLSPHGSHCCWEGVCSGVLCPQMGPGWKWGRGGEPVCTEAESPHHFQDPVHPFLLLFNGSWQSTVPSGVELAGYTLGFKIMSGKFHTNSIFKRRVWCLNKPIQCHFHCCIFISYWRERKTGIEQFTLTSVTVQFSDSHDQVYSVLGSSTDCRVLKRYSFFFLCLFTE